MHPEFSISTKTFAWLRMSSCREANNRQQRNRERNREREREKGGWVGRDNNVTKQRRANDATLEKIQDEKKKTIVYV